MEYATAERIAAEARRLTEEGKLSAAKIPVTRQGIEKLCRRHNVPYREEKSRGGRGGVTRLYLLSAIPGLPAPLREAFGAAAVSQAAKAGEAARRDQEELRRREESLARFAALPPNRQQTARARHEVLRACEEFLRGGGYRGRTVAGRPRWHTGGVHAFVRAFNGGSIPLEPWVTEEIGTSIGYRTLLHWRERCEADGLLGLADRYRGRVSSTLTQAHQDFLVACICEHPHITSSKLALAMEARFGGEIPGVWAVNRYVKKWRQENASLYLYLTNPDEWRSRYMFAAGDASEQVTALNQLWEADSTPGDIMLVDGRHTIIGMIDVYSRRSRFLVAPTSKSAAIAALVRRCLLEWGVPDAVKTDNGKDYTANYLEAVLRDLGIAHPLCTPFSPEEKPHIERVLQTMSHGIVELLPGYIGHSVAERKAIEARASFARRLMGRGETVEISLTSVELQKILDRWTDAVYMQAPHAGLDGRTPAEMVRSWPHPVKRITNERALDVLLFPSTEKGGVRVIGKKGIRVTEGAAILRYWAPEFAGREGESVRVCPDRSDLGHAAIYTLAGEFLCWAEDPAWYGISLAEAGKHLRNKQKQVMAEGAKELRRLAREQKTREIHAEILESRERRLREESAKVVELPKRAEEHITPALEEAARAVDVRENGRQDQGTGLTPEQLAAKERIRREMEEARQQNVASFQLESGKAKYLKYTELRVKLTIGAMGYRELLTEEEYRELIAYEQSNEYRAWKGIEEELGIN